MVINTKKGSKERLIEIFQRVNKIKLNENALSEEYNWDYFNDATFMLNDQPVEKETVKFFGQNGVIHANVNGEHYKIRKTEQPNVFNLVPRGGTGANNNMFTEEYEDLDAPDLEIPNDRYVKRAKGVANQDIEQHYTKNTGSPSGFDVKNPRVAIPSDKWSKKPVDYDTKMLIDSPIDEARPFVLGKGYTHFATDNATGKIVTGWDYKGYDQAELRQFKKDYFYNDLKDMDVDPKSMRIVTRHYLETTEGIDPSDTNNWLKDLQSVNPIDKAANNQLSGKEFNSMIPKGDVSIPPKDYSTYANVEEEAEKTIDNIKPDNFYHGVAAKQNLGVKPVNNILNKIDNKNSIVRQSTPIKETTDHERYENVVFLQGDEAFQPLELLDSHGPEAALQYLKQWHYSGEHEGSNELGQGTSDQTFEKDGYIMSWNPRLDYIELQYDTQMGNEAPIDETKEIYKRLSNEKNKDGMDYLKKKNERKLNIEKKKASSINEHDVEEPLKYGFDGDVDDTANGYSTPGANTNVELEPNATKGFDDQLPGGVGDDSGSQKFSADQIRKGLKVEMEHTDDPLVAMDIVIDHLTEDENYYGDNTQDPEQAAQCGAMTDANDGVSDGNNDGVTDVMNNPEDKEETDILLGFKPMNVGDAPELTESRLTRDDIYKWIEEAIVAENIDKATADKMMEFGLNREIITDEFLSLISTDRMDASEVANMVINTYNNGNSIQEYDNYNYPAGADADPRAPWHEKNPPEGHEDDDFEDFDPEPEGDIYRNRRED